MVIDQLIDGIVAKRNPCIVGIDPEWERIPACFREGAATPGEAIRDWGMTVIDAVADVVAAVKPQMAFFEVFGAEGVQVHQQLVAHAHRRGLVVVDDSKRCDIGNTARAYAYAHLAKAGPINADMLTVTPFLGRDSLQPFLDVAKRDGKGLFVLVRTSNPGSGEIAEAVNGRGERLCDFLADYVREAGRDCTGRHGYASVGAVVGATWPEEAARLRQRMPGCFFLVPGYGAQGGGAADVVPCFNPDGLGTLVSSSRGVLYSWEREADFDGTRAGYARSVRRSAGEMQRQVYAALRAACPEMVY